MVLKFTIKMVLNLITIVIEVIYIVWLETGTRQKF